MGNYCDFSSIRARTTGRQGSLFQYDVDARMCGRVEGKRMLVTGGARSIGSATVRQLARYGQALLATVDLSENCLIEPRAGGSH